MGRGTAGGVNITQTVGEFAERIRGAREHAELKDTFRETVRQFGISYFAYHIVTVAGVSDHLVYGITTYPDDWVQRYTDRDYVHLDPVVLRGLKRATPFRWDQLTATEMENPRQKAFWREADDLAIRHGFTVPIHGRRSFALMSVVSDGSPCEAKRDLEEHQDLFHLLALYYHNQASGILLDDYFKGVRPQLTARERECLSWIAQGKTNWEVSVILGIAERTVLYYVENAKTKLGVFSRAEAVAKAVVSGLIDYP